MKGLVRPSCCGTTARISSTCSVRKYVHTLTRAHAYTHTRSYTPTIRTHSVTYPPHTHTRTRARTHVHAHKHSHIHTHTHTQTNRPNTYYYPSGQPVPPKGGVSPTEITAEDFAEMIQKHRKRRADSEVRQGALKKTFSQRLNRI